MIRRQRNRMAFLRRTIGLKGLVPRIARRLLGPLYQSEALVVSNLYIELVNSQPERGADSVRGEVASSVTALEERRPDIHPDIDFGYLRRFLEERPASRFVLLFQYERPDGSRQYVGFRTIEQGYFEMPEYGLGGEMDRTVGTVYEVEVARSYRGRGIHGRTRRDMHIECVRRGIKHTTGVTRSHNVASLRSGMKQTPGVLATYNGAFRLRRWLGRWVQAPPWSEIRALLESPPGPLKIPERLVVLGD